MVKLLICLLCCCCLVVDVYAVPRSSQALTLCYEDQNSYPWVMTDGSGLNLQLLRLVADAVDAGAETGALGALAALAAEAGATEEDATGRVTTPVSAATAAAAALGGAGTVDVTRSTCPTSIRLGFSRLFQRAMSFQP